MDELRDALKYCRACGGSTPVTSGTCGRCGAADFSGPPPPILDAKAVGPRCTLCNQRMERLETNPFSMPGVVLFLFGVAVGVVGVFTWLLAARATGVAIIVQGAAIVVAGGLIGLHSRSLLRCEGCGMVVPFMDGSGR